MKNKWLYLLFFGLSVFSVSAMARVASPTLAMLVKKSELIVVVKVTHITPQAHGVSLATAEVIETWKGNPTNPITYIAKTEIACDVANVAVRQTTVLFLKKPRAKTVWTIAALGRSQMTISEADGSTRASLVGVPLDTLRAYVEHALQKKIN